MSTQIDSVSSPKPARRRFLALGIGAAVVLAVGGGVASAVKPALVGSRLTDIGRAVFSAVGLAVLGGVLPPVGPLRVRALEGYLSRIDALIAGLPMHAQDELGQLLSLLGTSAGRLGLAGLSAPWLDASAEQVQAAMQSMRLSSLGLKRQGYHALQNIASGAYFSDSSTWAVMGYPGPPPIA